MPGVIASIPKFQFSANGVPMVGGTLTAYIAGTTTLTNTWQDAALTVANTNPIVLDARGECVLWLDPAVVYKFILKNAQGAVQWTQDGINNGAALANALRTELAASNGASLIGLNQSGASAITRTVQDKLRDTISVFDFMSPLQIADVLAKTYLVDVTAAINLAISAASIMGKTLLVPTGGYRIVPATAKTDEAGSNLCALPMTSNMHIDAEPGAVFRIANGVSTDAAPKRMSMFFSNQFLSNISIKGLTLDMNGDNNKISPNRATLVFNRFTQAHILFSGTPGGIAAGGNNVLIEKCRFINTAGVTCIGMAQTNTPFAVLGRGWKLLKNEFYNNGLDTDDHSSVFGWANDVDVISNTFNNPAMYSNATRTGGLVCYEVHGSNTKIIGNTFENYYQALWLSINLTDTTKNITVCGNAAKVSGCFSDFYSANIGTGPAPDQAIQGVNIFGNVIDITSDAVGDQIKVFFKIAARQQPSMVNIYGNVCRSFETVKNTVLATIAVLPDQLAAADFINIHNNTAAGINAGLIVYFGGTGAALNINSVSFENNKLGNLIPSPGGLYQNKDVILYGPAAGKVAVLRLGGLETPIAPVLTDSAAGGRATVYGKTLLDLPVTWGGVTIGNGGYSKQIALDSDAGQAVVSVGFIAGSTTTYAGNISPAITGIVSRVTGTATAVHTKSGTAVLLPALIFATSNGVSLYTATGALFDAAQAATNSYVMVSAVIPCSNASI